MASDALAIVADPANASVINGLLVMATPQATGPSLMAQDDWGVVKAALWMR